MFELTENFMGQHAPCRLGALAKIRPHVHDIPAKNSLTLILLVANVANTK